MGDHRSAQGRGYMPYNPEIHHRRSIRLRDYDYSKEGAYFITVCIKNRECVLGKIENGKMTLDEYGMIVEKEWLRTETMCFNILMANYIVMPNHFHGIIIINADCRGGVTPPLRKYTLGQIVAYFKYQTVKQINQIRKTPGIPVWQRNYYEHIIRNKKELDNIRRYIEANPVLWEYDMENPNCLPVAEPWEESTT